MRKIITILALSLAASLMFSEAGAKTGDYIVEIDAGKKILNVQKLNLSPTTRLSELLEIFPELLAREGYLRLENYDLQIEDVSTGDSKTVVIEQLTLSDIKDIEVSATPSASQQKNGQGGVIQIHLNDLKEGFSGEAIAEAGSAIAVSPSVKLNYRKGPWSLRGSVIFNYYHPRNENSIRETMTDNLNKYQTDSSAIDNSYELVNFDAVYKPEKHIKLHLWGWEKLDLDSNLSKSEVEVNSVTTDQSYLLKQYNFAWLAGANYTHTFDKSEIEAEFTCENSPGSDKYDKYNELSGKSAHYLSYSQNYFDNRLGGLLKYKYNFVPETPKKKAALTLGVNTNYSGSKLDYDYDKTQPHIKLNGSASLFYLSPYIESNNIFGKWFLKASVRYLHYSQKMSIDCVSPFSRLEDYFTGFLSAGYQIAPHHHLSMILDRSVIRGNFLQMYPYKIFDPTKESFSLGEPSLNPTCTNSASLNYITDFSSGDNNFTFDLELKYMSNADIITSYYIEDNVLKYCNDGRSNIGAANFLFRYSSKIFNLSFTANAFNNFTQISNVNDQFFNYNLAVIPSLNFEQGWTVSAQFAYNSHVYTLRSRQSDYFFANTRVSKSWEKWTLYLVLDDNFHKIVCDETFKDPVTECYWHNLHKPSLSVGAHIKF